MKKRVLSLDVLRGLTIVGMIFVNNVGNLSCPTLHHAAWNGLTLADLVFPLFLFIMGMSTFLSLRKYSFVPTREVFVKIIRRTLLLLLIGWALHAWENCWSGLLNFSQFSLSHLRLTGVLPRIAVCYLLTAIVALFVKRRYIPYLILTLLVGYTLLLCLGNGFALDETNVLSTVDRHVLGASHLYQKSVVDPEGLLSTLSALCNSLVGFFLAPLLTDKKAPQLATIGVALLVVGLIVSTLLPLNKRVWSPSYVLVSCGVASLLLSLLLYVVDIHGWRRWCRPLMVYGVNPLFLYVLSEMMATIVGYSGVFYSLALILILGLLGEWLFQKKIYIKI